jgi:MYXO-CTERM domain-containing protein
MKTRNSQLSMFKMIAQGAAALTMLLLASAVSAQECQADADCGDGYRCELYSGGGAISCEVTPEGEEICEEFIPEEPTSGYCVREPILCTSDADCGAGLKCHLPDVGVAPDEAAPPCAEGEECGSEDPAPGDDNNSGLVAPQGYCGWAFVDCTADADCGEFGECVSVGGSDCGGAAPFPDCADGEDCPEPEPVDCGEPVELFACVPAEIDCETDDQCPTDWACVEYSYGYCEGSDGGTSTGGGSDPDEGEGDDDSDGERPAPDEGECFEEIVRRCTPPGLDVLADSQGGGDGEITGEPRPLDEDGEEPQAPGEGDDNGGDSNSNGADGEGDTDEDAGGCSVSGSGHGSQGGLLASLLLGLVTLAARRRRA